MCVLVTLQMEDTPGMEYWNPLNVMEDGLAEPNLLVFSPLPLDSDSGSTVVDTPSPTAGSSATEQCAHLIAQALRTWNSVDDIANLRVLVENTLTTDVMVLELFRQLYAQSIHNLRLITARLGDAGFRVDPHMRPLLRRQMIEALLADPPAEMRKHLLTTFTFLLDVYAITTIADLRSHTRDPEAGEQIQKRQELIRNYFTIRDDLALLGLWVDAQVQNWRTWPSRARLPTRTQVSVQSAFLQFTATLAPMLLPIVDTDVRQAYANTIADAHLSNGGLLRLSDFQTKMSPVLRRSVYTHLLSIAEQMTVRALDHIQFIVFDGRRDTHIGGMFKGGVRRNWATPLMDTFVFVAPLTRLASERNITEEALRVARALSSLLLPESLQERAHPQGEALLHEGDVRVRVQELEGPVALLRDLAAQGNRDGRRPLDVYVGALPFNKTVRLHVLGFLVNLGQVWARRLVLEEPLARALLADGLNTPGFWTGSSLAPMWPLFKPIQEGEQTLHVWFPHQVERVRGREPKAELLTHSKDNLAPSDSNPSFPRGLYGTAQQ